MSEEREVMEVDVLYVGAGPANLSSALHLMNLVKRQNEGIEKGELQGEPIAPPSVAIIEKGASANSHALSGALLDPVALAELMPDYLEKGFPAEGEVTSEQVYLLTAERAIRMVPTPPPLRNHGNYVISLYKLVGWLAQQVEAAGVDIFPGFAGRELLFEGDRVAGVRTGDKGIDKNGEKRANYEAGIDLRAKVTVLGEGPRGTLTKALTEKMNLQGLNPQTYAAGVKEAWEVPAGRFEKGRVLHTMGWPLDSHTYGGSFIYGMDQNRLSVGFVTGLDSGNASTDPHANLQRFKSHPLIRRILQGGKMLNYGAKTVPMGGYYAIPKTWLDGCLIIGDSASFLNSQRLKGIHTGMKTGMLAAETILEALRKGDTGEETLRAFRGRVEESWVKRELWKVRNFHQGFKRGLVPGLLSAGLQLITGGRGLIDPIHVEEDHKHTRKLNEGDRPIEKVAPDGKLFFDKETSVYHSGTSHELNQPSHLLIENTDICNGICAEEYGNPCENFCPAKVYEMVADENTGKKQIVVHGENCVHCKTCDIADPYAIITWVPPEGGGGPDYQNL